MDYLFYNTKNEKNNFDALLVRDDKIYAVGSYHLLNKIATNPEKIDLKGNILLPAFTDAHTHFVETAKQKLVLNVSGCVTDDEFYQKLVEYRENLLNKEFQVSQTLPTWIKGFGWEKRNIDKYPNINKRLIDKVFPDIPVSIASRDLHSNLCNSKALEVINVTQSSILQNSPSLSQDSAFLSAGIEIGRFSDGEPNGFLYENSWSIIDKYIPPIDTELLKKLVQELITKCHKYGLCGVHSIEDMKSAEIVKSICEDNDFYFIWYYSQFGDVGNALVRSEEKHPHLPPLAKGGKEENVLVHSTEGKSFLSESPHFRNGGIKLFTDGSLGSDSAWMFEKLDFENPASELKKSIKMTLDDIQNIIINAHKQNIQVAIHAIGDYAVYITASMLKEINQKYGNHIKHRIEHLQAVRPEDIQLLKAANIHASMQAIHIKEDFELIQKKWKKAKDYSFPLKSVSDAVELALGSDAPVETLNPFEGIKYAVKLNQSNKADSAFEVLSLEQAINSYTYKHHIIANKPITYGLLEKGQIANLIVVKKELFDDIWSIDDSETEMTMIDGKIVKS